jgi:hypothetical protein
MTGKAVVTDVPIVTFAPPVDALLDLLERIGDLDQRLSDLENNHPLVLIARHLEQLVERMDALENGDAPRLDALAARIDSLEKTRRTPLPVELHVNEVTVTKKTQNVQVPARLADNLLFQLEDLRIRIAQTEHNVTRLTAPNDDLKRQLRDERDARVGADDRLAREVRALDKRVGLGSKLFSRFNRRLVQLTGAGVVETKGG